jgi:phage FluMu gp28-like protein
LKLAKKIFKDLTSVLPAELLVTCNASDLVIESVTGSSLWFYSAEQGDKIRGITNNYLIIDEAAFLKNGTDLWYSILSPTIKVKGEKILFISTPNGTNNLFYELAIKA